MALVEDRLQGWPWKDEATNRWVYSRPDTHQREGMKLQLNLHEVGEVLRRAALTAGLFPDAEVKVGSRKIDWCWFIKENGAPTGQVVAAFEIEGRDVEKTYDRKKRLRGIEKDFESFSALDQDCLRVIILYTMGKAGEEKGEEKKPTPAQRVARLNNEHAFKGKSAVELCYDEDIFNRISNWIERALKSCERGDNSP